MLTAEQILKADDLGELVKVSVPEWGGDVYVKVMTGRARDYFELTGQKTIENPKINSIRALLCAATICDENGKLLFTNAQVGDLAEKSGSALDKVFTVAQKINKMANSDIEELEKNFGAIHLENSGSS